jgi:hypothetical protein
MAGLVPAIHVFLALGAAKTWMPGTRSGMTKTLVQPDFHWLLFASDSKDVDGRDKPGHDGGESGGEGEERTAMTAE